MVREGNADSLRYRAGCNEAVLYGRLYGRKCHRTEDQVLRVANEQTKIEEYEAAAWYPSKGCQLQWSVTTGCQ